MIDRYTKILLTVIAVNLTIMVGWEGAKVLVPDVSAGSVQDVNIVAVGDVEIVKNLDTGVLPVWCAYGCN